MSGLKGITVNTAPEMEAHIYAEDDAAVYESIFGKDGVTSIGEQCKATVLSNNKVRVSDGIIIVGGHLARIPYGDYEDAEIMNGQTGKNRNDIIIAKFLTTGNGGIDDFTLEVKQGTPGTTGIDPLLTQEDLYQAGKVREIPLYRVKIEGLSIVAVEKMFTIVKTNKELQEELKGLQEEIQLSNGATIVPYELENGTKGVAFRVPGSKGIHSFVFTNSGDIWINGKLMLGNPIT